MEGVVSLRHALRVARDLTSGSNVGGDTEFWNALATKLVAALMIRARAGSRDIFDVAAAVEHRHLELWLDDERSDEAATVASLDELDQLAATVSGLDVTLVTVVQDFAQLVARWGPRAATIVNNHTTRMVLGGLADPTVATYLPELAELEKGTRPVLIRQRPSGTALVVAGRSPVSVVRLRPWWKIRRLQHRGTLEALLPSNHGDRGVPSVGTDTGN